MEETKFVRVAHKGEAHFVALYTGLNPAEFSRLLQAAFKVPQHVVGLMERATTSEQENGVVVPLSLACRAPQILGDRSYSLLLSDKEVMWERTRAKNPTLGSPMAMDMEWQVASSAARATGLAEGDTQNRDDDDQAKAGGVGKRQVPKPVTRTLWAEEDEQGEAQGDDERGEEEDEVREGEGGVNSGDKERIVAFIRRMAFNGLLTRDDQAALESSAVAGDVVINAAFAVALHSQDLDYLSALFKDIATNRRDNPQGMRLLEAKREMLDMAEVLQQADEVDDEQLVYLQNLILVSNEAVTEAFGVYEEDQDPVRLAESLKKLCGAEASSTESVATAGIFPSGNGGGVDDDDDVLGSDAERSAMKATILKVAINLTNEGLLGAREANVVNDMINRENPVLVAAFKLFQKYGKAAELYDTVARATRYEAKRAVAPSATQGEPRNVTKAALTPNTSALRSAASRGGGAAPAKAIVDVGGAGARGLTQGGVDEDTASGEMAMAAEAALAEFQRLVTVAVQKGLMDMSDARVICSAFESGLNGGVGRLQDLVHAAWGVYTTGGGEEDALDSLVRIVRLTVKPFQPAHVKAALANTSPATATATPSATSGKGAAASTADLRESMSAAVHAIATQSAQILLHNNKVSAEEASCLASPSPDGCQAILQALEVFEGDSNREVLLDTFAVLAKSELAKRQGSKLQREVEKEGKEGGGGGEDGDEDRRRGEENGAADQDEEEDEEDEAEDEANQDLSSDRAISELMELADCMAGDKRIDAQEALLLGGLIERKDPQVMIAYTNYTASQDVSALVSALMAIVRTQGTSAFAGVPAAAATGYAEAGKEIGNGKGGPGGQAEMGDQNGRERVVLLMHETRVLNASDATRVLLLLAREDPNTLAAFEAFDLSKDVSSLVESIKAILQEASPITPKDLTMAMHQDGDRSNSSPLLRQILQPQSHRQPLSKIEIGQGNVDDDDNDDGGGRGGGTDSPGTNETDDAVAENVVSIVDGMGLDENEAAALRFAIARGDANIRGALELFRLDPDAEELKDTIARVARLVLEREGHTGQVDQVPGASGAINDGARGNVSAITDTDADTGATAADAGARSIDFTLEEKTGLFQELLEQLVGVGVMSKAQAAVVVDRYRNKDAVVLAALDVYKNENDMSELVDTLKRLT